MFTEDNGTQGRGWRGRDAVGRFRLPARLELWIAGLPGGAGSGCRVAGVVPGWCRGGAGVVPGWCRGGAGVVPGWCRGAGCRVLPGAAG
jgi:hypothetical protein